jgi:hypothetical protein
MPVIGVRPDRLFAVDSAAGLQTRADKLAPFAGRRSASYDGTINLCQEMQREHERREGCAGMRTRFCLLL